jgi:hypothetical protein
MDNPLPFQAFQTGRNAREMIVSFDTNILVYATAAPPVLLSAFSFADRTPIVIHELNARLLEGLLNPEQGRNVTHCDSLLSFDPADSRVSDARYSKGLRTSAPRPATSTIFRVTSVIPCTLAVAASSASVVGNGRLALMRPHSSATT